MNGVGRSIRRRRSVRRYQREVQGNLAQYREVPWATRADFAFQRRYRCEVVKDGRFLASDEKLDLSSEVAFVWSVNNEMGELVGTVWELSDDYWARFPIAHLCDQLESCYVRRLPVHGDRPGEYQDAEAGWLLRGGELGVVFKARLDDHERQDRC